MSPSPKFYDFRDYRCAYTLQAPETSSTELALLLIHPIGVGLSGNFWQRFNQAWQAENLGISIYNPDLLGCGASAMPRLACYPEDFAAQLDYFLQSVVKKPVILVVQGALFPVAIKLLQRSSSSWIRGLVLSGPPAWRVMSQPGKPRQQKWLWNLFFDSPLGIGNLFYRYARRRQFLQSFSAKQLFGEAEAIDDEWLDFLQAGAQDLASRYAVFSFLAGFWREDYRQAIAEIQQPTLVVFGDRASSISREGFSESPEQRLEHYLKALPKGQGCIIPGRNVLPYESTNAFVELVKNFVIQV